VVELDGTSAERGDGTGAAAEGADEEGADEEDAVPDVGGADDGGVHEQPSATSATRACLIYAATSSA